MTDTFELSGTYTAEQLADLLTTFMVDHEVQKCMCCAESMSLLPRTLSRQMVDSLAKIARRVHETDENNVIPAEFTGDLRLNRTQYNNLNVLKKHGMIAKLKNQADKKIHYCITRKGYQFITGQIAVPKTVWSFRNKTVRKSEDMVTVQDVWGEPYTDIRESLFFQPPAIDEVEKAKVHHKVKRKKRKNPCPNCATGELKKRMTAEIVNDVARPTYFSVCNVCGFQPEEN